jgi:hypothetical protein
VAYQSHIGHLTGLWFLPNLAQGLNTTTNNNNNNNELQLFSWQVFHLRDIRWEKPQFLSKSFLGFVTFNIITYSLLLAEFVTTNANTSLEKKVN